MEGPGSDLIGRDVELRALVAAIEADQGAIVVGEAGIGKTALVRAAVATTGRRLHEGGGFATLNRLPYLALRRATGAGLAGDAAAVAAQVERLVGPDVLFVDDLHWVDVDSQAVIALLADRILIVAAIRTGDPGAAAALELVQRSGSVLITLDGLGDAAAARLIQRARPEASERVAAGIVRQAGGNPLLLEELALGGEASTALERALVSRFERLDRDAQESLELLAVADRALPRDAAGPGAAAALEAGLARQTPDGMAIRHQLVADAIQEQLTLDRRAALHVQLAALATDPVEQARHLVAGGRAAEAEAMALEAIGSTIDARRRATLLEVAAEAGGAGSRLDLRLPAARALDELSDWPGVRRVLGVPAEGSAEELCERDVIIAHATFAMGDPVGARRSLDDAAERGAAPQSEAAARLAIEEATYLVNVEGRVAEAIARLAGVLSGNPAPETVRDASVLRACILLLATGEGDPGVIGAGLEEAFAAGRYRTATDRARVLQYAMLMGVSTEEALGFLLAQHRRFDAAGVGVAALEFLADAVVAAVLAGHLEQALLLADELLEQPAPPRAVQTAAIHRAQALTLAGRFDQAESTLAEALRVASPDWFGRGLGLAVQAELAYWSGRYDAAETLALAALGVPAPVPVAHVNVLLTQAWVRTELGHDPGGPLAVDLTPSLAGARNEVDGLRAWHAGDMAAARTAFVEAGRQWAAFHVPHYLVCRWAAAESLRRSGDVEAAAAELADVLAEATRAGMEPVAARIRRSLRLAGVRSSAEPRGHPSDSLGLTPRERELVALVEQGLTNVEIARRLGLGRPTVTRILGSAMTKLGVGSRAQMVARLGS
ncbi:MAG TPA: LuxR C-terminal-related transcriptional regulator [Candidatus Limnocylindrales bacterium]